MKTESKSPDKQKRQSKSRPLDRALRVRIGRFKAKNPKWKTTEIADKFHVTPDQARYAINLYNEDQLKCNEPEAEPATDFGKIENVQEADAELENQYIEAVEKLKNTKNAPLQDVVKMIETCVKLRILLDKLNLYHIRKLDVDILRAVVRLLDPDKTNEEIYNLYKQAVEICKANKATKKK